MPTRMRPDIQAVSSAIAKEMRGAVSDSLSIAYREVYRRYSGPTGRASLSRRGGQLRDALRTSVKGSYPQIQAKVHLEPQPIYAHVHEFGKTIKAKRAPYLVFVYKGRWRKKKQVTIPRRPVWEQSAKTVRPRIDKRFARAIERAIAAVKG